MTQSIHSILQGGHYAIDGIRIFYTDKRLWRYAFLSLLVLTLFYLLIAFGAVFLTKVVCAELQAFFEQLPAWLSWLSLMANGVIGIVMIITVALLVALTISSLYEIFGGFFFDSMIEAYEQNYFSFHQDKQSFKRTLIFFLEGVWYCLGTACLFCFLFPVSLFFPGIGFIVTLILCGYRTAISYLQTPASNVGYSLRQLREHCKNKYYVVLGFGITSYLMLLIPFAAIFVLPGLILGGTTVFHRELKESM